MAITITDFAKQKIRSLMLRSQNGEMYLRISLTSGGCSGFSYKFDYVKKPEEKDKEFDFGDIKICIDVKSYLFLNGMEIDYEETIFKSGIILNNPNAKRSCGCGESVSF
tara:strand:- start:8786 stop:9112 length:327 start_codon:yes stop_codon:yes gene_type:complete